MDDFRRRQRLRAVNDRAPPGLVSRDDSDCISSDPAETVTDRLNKAFESGGQGYKLQLCPGETYTLTDTIFYTAPGQELSTAGYPTGDDRALLVINGAINNGTGHTTAVDASCDDCDNTSLRNVQIFGNRGDRTITTGGANIEFGGQNSGQLIEYVRSYDPRSWSCLHVAEGGDTCSSITVQNNDIGPAGVDVFQQWADGISVACRNSIVRNNIVHNPTDGGIVIFGSPGTQVYNNTIEVHNQTLLGGINLVDFGAFKGDYTGTVVRDNTIYGGFATDDEDEDGQTKGENDDDAIIKMGIAIGPRAWFGGNAYNNISSSGTVINNKFSGAFTYGIALTSAKNFTVTGNSFTGNYSFIGARGPNCSDNATPSPGAFVVDQKTAVQSTYQTDFVAISDGDSLTCVLPPDGGDYWPYRADPNPSARKHGLSGGAKAGIAIGVIFGVIALGIAAWFIRRWALNRANEQRMYEASRRSQLMANKNPNKAY
ncbi:hypothetical protein EV714DRAFT_281175 [Schizophyllum commune]